MASSAFFPWIKSLMNDFSRSEPFHVYCKLRKLAKKRKKSRGMSKVERSKGKKNCVGGTSGAKLWFISLIQSTITARIDQRKEPTTNFLHSHLFAFFSHLIWFVWFFHQFYPPIAVLPFPCWLVLLYIIVLYLLCFGLGPFESWLLFKN